MYLKRLVINGFKSFADRTRIELRPGIIAIVGPNGCGKSNIVDAVRWVLGEQSAKALRGGNMHDVIFSGTDKRKALAFCEVELVFADCEKELGTAFHEISILRRVSRDDFSEYFLNGKPCRLKDVQRLFMDTGIGRVSYSFMVQGQIDQILSSNPAERRILFEEAAGITRYKMQRREALGKLALVDQNLARTTDVLDELTRQVNTLKRQAAKALRWKKIKHRLTHLELADLNRRFLEHRESAAELNKQAENLRIRSENQKSALAGREQTLAGNKSRRAELQTQIEACRQQIFSLRSAKEAAENDLKYSNARIRDLTERNESIAKEIEGILLKKNELKARLDGGGGNCEKQTGDVNSGEALFRLRQTEFEKTAANLSALESGLSRERSQLMSAETAIARSRAAAVSLEVELHSSEIRRTESANRLSQLKEECEKMRSRAADAEALAAAKREQQEKIRKEIETLREQTKKLNEAFRASQQIITQLDRRAAGTAAQIATLKQLQAKFEGFSEGSKNVLRGDFSEYFSEGTPETLNALLKIKQKFYGNAVEALLSANTAAVCLPAGTPVEKLLSALAEKNLEATLALPETPAAGTPFEGTLPEFLTPANDLVSVKNKAFEAPIRTLFDRCFVCDETERFLEFWREHPDFDFILAATPEGDLIDRRGIVRTAGTNEKKDSVFRREAEIASLEERAAAVNETLARENSRAEEIRNQSDENEEKTETARSGFSTLSQEISAVAADERNAKKSLENLLAEIRRQNDILAETERSRERAAQRMTAAKSELETNEKNAEALKASIAEKESRIAEARKNTDKAREAASEARFELAKRKQELEIIEREIKNIRAQFEETVRLEETREHEKRNNQNQINAYSAQTETDKNKISELQKALDGGNEGLEKLRGKFKNTEIEIESLEQSMSGDRKALAETETLLKNTEIKLAAETLFCKNIAEKTATEHQTDITSVDWREQLKKAVEKPETRSGTAELEEETTEDSETFGGNGGCPSENPDWEILKNEMENLRERLHTIGAINHTAIEEYGEVRERYHFTKRQSDDLWEAKNELVKAIDEINGTSQTLFTETFEQIRKNFNFTFERLFHGGESDLRLVQSDDVLESGIEIVARPPGTKLRGISLLSGGQRTMTAVALLFAIYMVKPSPFCVLDELDAPLDDANVGRFTEIVKEFTKYSQFLVVTHNKRTVSAANMIYGVTMQERGVTQLLSMRFNRDAAAPDVPADPDASNYPGKGGAFNMAR